MKEIFKICGEISVYAFAPLGVAAGIAVAEWLFRAII